MDVKNNIEKKNARKNFEALAVNTSAAAKILGCSEGLLRKFRSVGDGPVYAKLGFKIVYPLTELKRYLEENLVGSGGNNNER